MQQKSHRAARNLLRQDHTTSTEAPDGHYTNEGMNKMFLTYINTPQFVEMSFADLLSNRVVNPDLRQTRTIKIQDLNGINQNSKSKIQKLCEFLPPLVEPYIGQDMAQYYTSFRIPKHSGGTRQIDAPDYRLKTALTAIRLRFEWAGFLEHNNAYAYVKTRSTKDALERHTEKNHKWYLKMDLKNFFGSCSKEFIKQQLKKIALYNLIPEELLDNVLHTALLNDGLPQGTPFSPWLTNQVMIPFDYELTKFCHQHNIVYTRYADDLLFSTNSKTYLLNTVVPMVKEIFANTPLCINEEKTKISSICGKNWNLGLMINKDNQITVGTKRKERLRATITDFALNTENWTKTDAQELLGLLQYYQSIEPTYFQNLLTKYNNKYNINIRTALINKIK